MDTAVAIRYQTDFPAPYVVAKGRHELAERMTTLAKEHGVPVERREELVDILYLVDIGELIPEELYRVVAEVLVFVGWTPEMERANARNTG